MRSGNRHQWSNGRRDDTQVERADDQFGGGMGGEFAQQRATMLVHGPHAAVADDHDFLRVLAGRDEPQHVVFGGGQMDGTFHSASPMVVVQR